MSTLEERLAAVEQELAQVRGEWAVVQQTPLIQGRLLNALRETQVDHDRRLGKIERKLDEHTRLLVNLGNGQETIVRMLDSLISHGEHDGA